MRIRLNAGKFKSLIDRFITTSKCSVNLAIKGDLLQIQSSRGIVVNRYMRVEEFLDEKSNIDVTVELNKSVSLLENDEPLEVLLSKDIVVFTQNKISFTATKGPEECIEDEEVAAKRDNEVSLTQLSILLTKATQVENATKAISGACSALTIKDGYAYIAGPNCMLCSKIDMPDITISLENLKQLVRCSSKDILRYHINKEKSVMSFEIDEENGIAIMPYKRPIKSVYGVHKSIIEAASEDAISINLKEYSETISTFASVYKSTLVNVEIGKKGLAFSAGTGTSMFSIGDAGDSSFVIRLSVPQLQAAVRVFGDEIVEIRKGVRNIIIWSETFKRDLVISGTIYSAA